jgi:hypothetical protein
MNTIKKIIELSEYESVQAMELNDQIEVDGGPYMDLTIEKVGEIRLSVAHYYTQRGDLMSDPQVVFDVRKDEWVPLRFINSPYIEDFDETGLDQHAAFIEQWDDNLEDQGFIDRAKGEQ